MPLPESLSSWRRRRGGQLSVGADGLKAPTAARVDCQCQPCRRWGAAGVALHKGGDIRSIQELLYQSDLRTNTIYK
jgi:site-specific recombinase XerC